MCLLAVANGIELVAVGGNSAFCSGASVTLQCTLTGDVLTWDTPDGALNSIRGRLINKSDAGPYHGRLLENSTHLRSNLTFTFTSQTIISCSDGSVNISITVTVEGIPCVRLICAYKTERVNKSFNYHSTYCKWDHYYSPGSCMFTISIFTSLY